MAVQAQQSTPERVDTVVITGLGRSIETSVAVKKNSDNIVEVVSAEEIGKLPDVSIAESLARLPGLAAQRVGGRAQVIALRGLGPDFVGTTLNGRQQVTTGDNRGVEYDQFPSELINSAVVNKSADAGFVGGGIAGSVDLRTIRPLDIRGRQIVLNVRGEHNSNGALVAGSSATGNRISASYIDQFANNTVGVALGYAHLDSPGQDERYKAWGFQTMPRPSWCADRCKPTGLADGDTVLSGFENWAWSRKQKRDGLLGVLEYKPSANLHSMVDVYYSKFKKDESVVGLMGFLGEGWDGNANNKKPGFAYSNISRTAVGNATLVTGADVANLNNLVRNDLNTRDDELKSIGWNTKLKLGDGWTVTGDLSYSRADRSENVIETYANAATFSSARIEVPLSGPMRMTSNSLNYADPTKILLTDGMGWGQDGLWKMPKVKDEIKAFRLDAKRTLSGWFTSLDMGIDYADRYKAREMNELKAVLNNGRAPVAVAADLLRAPTGLGFAGVPGVLTYDVMGVLGRYYTLSPQAVDQIIARNYEVSEKVTTAFAKVNFDANVGAIPVSGNLGAQFIHTKQSSHGYSKLSSVISETTRGTSYNDVLPSLNVKFDFGSDRYLRVGASQSMSRARIDDMRAGADVSISATGTPTWSGNGGNPQLEPWRAKSFDLSFEKYLGKRSYYALAGFYKNLDTYIYKQKLIYDFTGIRNTTALSPPSNLGIFERPMNGNGGFVRGVEFSGALEGSLLHPALNGFGALFGISHVDSSVSPNGPGTSQKLPGLSGVTASSTLYYEKGGFAARVNYTYRSPFRGEINGLHNARSFEEILAERTVDAQIGYEFKSGQFKGLGVVLQGKNLTNAPYATRQGNGFGDVIAPERYETYGRQVFLGVSYKL
ncbi:MAG: TonB-dependent receptor [Burkholderiales bacterium]|nr:TonB-dependent receptor [Burkholderiales bacterium]